MEVRSNLHPFSIVKFRFKKKNNQSLYEIKQTKNEPEMRHIR